ncbi:L-amino acid oxidase 1 [Mycena sanguinolenta]|uniref:L-amino acid oxidase 1 n=1 Tax=Mycena sanguinolenta TaxID=230812 RepID=A0A8H6YCF8_9AGAR|nr:L-amino acid oxidase 1 [Mycena sanguinolenta]
MLTRSFESLRTGIRISRLMTDPFPKLSLRLRTGRRLLNLTWSPRSWPTTFWEPSNDPVSWTQLLKTFDQDRRARGLGDHEGMIPVRPPLWFRVAIIGAGVAGLRTAKLLQDMGIPYKIFEASDRPGGRIFTYQFASKPPGDPQGKHDYYDVGAMRFPNNDANEATFKLFEELGLSDKLIDYVFTRDNNIRYYNGIKSTAAEASTKGDHFKDEIVPEEFLEKEYVDLRGKTVFGVDACTAAAFDPFRKALIDDFDEGWKELMKYDWASTRSYLARESPKYPLSVVHWMETRDSGTGGFDRAFAEDILESLEFNDPTKDVEWKCFEGGSKVLIDAMLDKLDDKPFYGHRVTSVKPLFRLPDLPGWPIFPFMEVSIAGQGVEHFTHVVSTASFANLGTIDTDQVPMTYKQRQAIRTLNYGPAVKVAIKFKTRWWESDSLNQRGGSSYTDRQSRVVVYPSAGLGEEGPGVLMATYNWHQDASRFGALIQNPDWSEQLDPDRKRPRSEQVLLEQIYEDLATLHGVTVDWLREQTLDYHAFDWYHNPYTMGAFAHFAPGQFSLLFSDIVQPAGSGRFHFAGEVASYHHAWVAGALDSATRVVREILRLDLPCLLPKLKERSLVFSDEAHAESQFVRGLLSKELEGAGF